MEDFFNSIGAFIYGVVMVGGIIFCIFRGIYRFFINIKVKSKSIKIPKIKELNENYHLYESYFFDFEFNLYKKNKKDFDKVNHYLFLMNSIKKNKVVISNTLKEYILAKYLYDDYQKKVKEICDSTESEDNISYGLGFINKEKEIISELILKPKFYNMKFSIKFITDDPTYSGGFDFPEKPGMLNEIIYAVEESVDQDFFVDIKNKRVISTKKHNKENYLNNPLIPFISYDEWLKQRKKFYYAIYIDCNKIKDRRFNKPYIILKELKESYMKDEIDISYFEFESILSQNYYEICYKDDFAFKKDYQSLSEAYGESTIIGNSLLKLNYVDLLNFRDCEKLIKGLKANYYIFNCTLSVYDTIVYLNQKYGITRSNIKDSMEKVFALIEKTFLFNIYEIKKVFSNDPFIKYIAKDLLKELIKNRISFVTSEMIKQDYKQCLYRITKRPSIADPDLLLSLFLAKKRKISLLKIKKLLLNKFNISLSIKEIENLAKESTYNYDEKERLVYATHKSFLVSASQEI